MKPKCTSNKRGTILCQFLNHEVLKNIRWVLLHLFWKELSVDDEGGSSSLIKSKSDEGRENLTERAEDEKGAKRQDRWKFGGLELCICSSFVSAERLLSAPHLRLPLIRLMLTPISLLHSAPPWPLTSSLRGAVQKKGGREKGEIDASEREKPSEKK